MKSAVLFLFYVCLLGGEVTLAKLSYNLERNISDVAIALSEIINGLKPRQLAILARPPLKWNATPTATTPEIDGTQIFDDDNAPRHVDDFIYRIHRLYFKSVIFYDVELFFRHIETNLLGSIESVNLIFYKPYELSARIQERKLSHRLSLFIFYWGAKYPPKACEVRFEAPIRAVVITRPRKKAFRIYFNQAVPTGESNLKLVNWYDGDNLGLQKVPLLPNAASVYANFQGRVFHVPVFHSPPWFWVSYNNESNESEESNSNNSNNNSRGLMDYMNANSYESASDEYNDVNVTGGRDHRLLQLLAAHMNFQFVYIEAPGRTQGSLRGSINEAINESFTGGIGMLQSGLADFFLGDVGLSWERRKAIEFSFFTLADSGAFATHAPRRLNEALAIMRPFKMDIWPYLILTVLFSGPIFYAIIAIPYWWQGKRRVHDLDVEQLGALGIHMTYIKEITQLNTPVKRRLIRAQHVDNDDEPKMLPKHLFDRCVWYTVQLFLKQSCHELYDGYRAKFLMIVYWIAATYVLADVYAAQLTSQFARPAHEPPINTLQRLQSVMLKQGYKLYVEKESSSLEMLENGTEIFRQLYALMKQQQQPTEQQSCQRSNDDDEVEVERGFLIDSVEAGIKLIADGLENKAVLGGRETLFFNIQQYGAKKFQLSQKLYTRYSAVAVQIGCPFLDSLNDVLIHLFEGGIIDKMTTAEYEAQSRMISNELNEQKTQVKRKTTTTTKHNKNVASKEHLAADEAADATDNNKNNEVNGKSAEHATSTTTTTMQQIAQDTETIQALNLRMLQGAFIVLFVGYGTAVLILLLELFCHRWTCQVEPLQLMSVLRRRCWRIARRLSQRWWRRFIRDTVRILR